MQLIHIEKQKFCFMLSPHSRAAYDVLCTLRYPTHVCKVQRTIFIKSFGIDRHKFQLQRNTVVGSMQIDMCLNEYNSICNIVRILMHIYISTGNVHMLTSTICQ